MEYFSFFSYYRPPRMRRRAPAEGGFLRHVGSDDCTENVQTNHFEETHPRQEVPDIETKGAVEKGRIDDRP